MDEAHNRATTVPAALEREALQRIDRRHTLIDASLHAILPVVSDFDPVHDPSVDDALDELRKAIGLVAGAPSEVRRRVATGTPALAIAIADWAEGFALPALGARGCAVAVDEVDAAFAALVASVAPRAAPPDAHDDETVLPCGCVDLLARSPADDASWQALVTALLVDDTVDRLVEHSLLPTMATAALAAGVRSHGECGPLCAFFMDQARHIALALAIGDLRLRRAAWELATAALAEAGHRAAGIAAAREAIVAAYEVPVVSAALELVDLVTGAAIDAARVGGLGRRVWS